jgi:hypothetical protein
MENKTHSPSAGLSDQGITAIDAAIQNAAKRKAAKGADGAQPSSEPKAAKAPSEPKRPRLTDEQKQARLAARDQDRAARKALREASRAEKLATRNANKQPAHMRKVTRAAEKLGTLAQAAALLFNEATANLSAVELSVLANHLLHFNRQKATERALEQSVEAGMEVTIVGGDARYVGRTGTVEKSQRIRCYVRVEGVNKPVYLFVSDVSPITEANSVAASA